MKIKLQALIEEQKALTAKFEEMLSSSIQTLNEVTLVAEDSDDSNIDEILSRIKYRLKMYDLYEDLEIIENETYFDVKIKFNGWNGEGFYQYYGKYFDEIIGDYLSEYYWSSGIQHIYIKKQLNPDPKKVYIKGHPTRGNEVIKMLEDLGGIDNGWCSGNDDNLVYFINHKRDGCIDWLLIKDFRNIIGDYTELHLLEEVNEIEPPKEEVEQLKFITASDTIVGEIYTLLANNYRYIFIHNGFGLNCFKPLCIMRFDEQMEFLSIGGSLSGKVPIIESSKAEKDYILKALEFNGKHFDKKNMRLLDVEEWGLVNNEPTPILIWEEDKWGVSIFDGVLTDDNSTCKNGIYDDIGIPYNDQTKHLIGTSHSPDKHYKFVENGEL